MAKILRRVVVTGCGAVTPLGPDTASLWRGLLSGECGVRARDDGYVAAPAPTPTLPPVQARTMNRSAQFAVTAAREAWADAGFGPRDLHDGILDPARVGVTLGTIMGGIEVLLTADRIVHGRPLAPRTAPMAIPSAASAHIAMDLGARGEARTVVSACASGTEAIGQALDRIRHGHTDIAIAGGTEAIINPTVLGSFAAMRALSATGSRPFDRTRDGFVLGEGAGLLILESRDHALARGARIYCEAAGWGLSADAHHVVAPRPDATGITAALTKALADADAVPSDVAHINAHATATVAGDAAETRALLALFGPDVPVTAPKGAIGHLQGGAGGVEAVITALTLHHGLIPPTVGCTDQDGTLNLVTEKPQPLPANGNIALSNSYGFGGHNAVLALRRHP
ncbi:beta-ketoacyl-[acyl-carrier-protein] synthase family protein [Winogradskya consettensis]|uniref:beta-ketoacyl-[acyl-carrier-protein] synthase family protein n=1 Tax=Winogradskya consettensis TaxID=113560 RepID=UPI001BB314B7|nr:beta-ketoacyl-[acyl-carrier-protein] synthase family protein [Actinoplanes consettensis]